MHAVGAACQSDVETVVDHNLRGRVADSVEHPPHKGRKGRCIEFALSHLYEIDACRRRRGSLRDGVSALPVSDEADEGSTSHEQ